MAKMTDACISIPELPQEILDALPPVLWRTDPLFKTLTGVSRRSIANMDCLGEGPAERIVMGKSRVGYPKAALVEWLSKRLRVETRSGGANRKQA